MSIRNTIRLLCLALLSCFLLSAHAATLTFEDIPLNGNPAPIGSGYGGFDWTFGTGIHGLNSAELGLSETGYGRGAVSGTHVAYNEGGGTETRLRWLGDGGFDLMQAFWSSAFLPSGHTLTFYGRNDGVDVFSPVMLQISDAAPALQIFNWTGIDELVIFSSTPSSQWVLDDFQYVASPLHAIPEPSIMLLLAMGMLLVLQWSARTAKRPG